MQKWMTEFSENEHAVYFASADKATRLVGFGCQNEISGWTDQRDLNAWVQQQRTAVFGGFNFDADQELPGIMGGYFFTPNQVIDLNEANDWGTTVVIMPKHPLQLLTETNEVDWTTRMQPVLETMQTDGAKQKVVLGMQTTLDFDASIDIAQLLESLVAQQPSSHHFVMKSGETIFVSATPERIVKLAGNQFETAAVAGSIRRGDDEQADTVLADALWHDQKNREEHQIVVNMWSSSLLISAS